MQHPLVNPSLAPFGFAFPNQQARLKCLPPNGGINAERIAARLWDRRNRLDAPRTPPVQTILHEILPPTPPRLAPKDTFTSKGLTYSQRDIRTLGSVVQWLGTNCGRAFLERKVPNSSVEDPGEEFVLRMRVENKRHLRPEIMAVWTHVCNEHCGKGTNNFFQGGHFYDLRSVTPRDEAVIMSFMRWLGQPDGRVFLQDFTRARDNISKRRWSRLWRPKAVV